MAQDGPPKRRLKPVEIVATGGVALVLAGTLPLALAGERIAAVSKARAWSVEGPACPRLSRAAFLDAPARIDRVIDYDDVLFGRGYGYVSCIEVADHGGRGPDQIPVCQFNSPTVLQVTTHRGDWYYFPRIGPATVTVEGERPRCVLGASIGP